MKHRILILALLLGTLCNGGAQNCIPRVKDHPFLSGETLSYDLLFRWGAVNTVVADAVFSLDSIAYNGAPAYHSVLAVKSAPFFDVFFKMRERFEGWMSADSIRPLEFIRNTREGSYTATNHFFYDWPSGVIHADVSSSYRPLEHLEIPLKDCVTDVGSVLYFTRGMDISSLKVGSEYPLRFAIDDQVYEIVLTYRGKDSVWRRRLGSVRCLKFSCSVVAGEMFDGSEDFSLWISDDSNRIPVCFIAPLRVGSICGWLKGWEKLKHPFKSLAR